MSLFVLQRENKTLEDFREMLDEEFSVNKSFWLKIGKVHQRWEETDTDITLSY
jgi:hypothetical protein